MCIVMASPAKPKPKCAALLTRCPECCLINYNEFFLHIEDLSKGYSQAYAAFNKICYLANMIVLHLIAKVCLKPLIVVNETIVFLFLYFNPVII